MRSLALLFILTSLASTAVQAEDLARSECVVVFSIGKNMSPSDPQVNQMWNQLNNSFGQFVSTRFKDAGKRVFHIPHPVEATDTRANTDRLLKKAGQEDCNLVVSVSMYADQQTRQFISSLRANPIVATRSRAPAGINYAIGEESFRKEQADPLSKETLDKLVPSDIANSLVDAYLNEKR